jgi:hypothetical protein
VTVDAGQRPVEGGVAEGKDPAIGAEEEVALAVVTGRAMSVAWRRLKLADSRTPLKVPTGMTPGGLTSCAISPSQSGTDVITWDNARLKISGKIKKLSYVEVQIEVSHFGETYSMRQQNEASEGSVFSPWVLRTNG